ncbi:retron Ec67 family RNA-directed DNA polymerase/endonuclease [Aeromonas veronii]|uniref:retron Ec67 family RNA-directed DNA polymerase/endonuclease n=1 Tax=Aeromonas veronii TaxID=654 RepID=UPI00226CB7A0|nr:retron Ec67 family RNA-directed DNA polymerase/endonuclease [Aeromonas veronii]MCX9114472.1 retron Ec67 family RNA-directed DNA polymerase/endonuclease [Aeromonas veronii]
MKKLDALRAAKTKPELAHLLGVKPSSLTFLLYKLKPSTQYSSFDIPKKNGGSRTIHAPSKKLKKLQSSLSNYLQDCIDEINSAKPAFSNKNKFIKIDKDRVLDGKTKNFTEYKFISTLSHGFVRERSIITNALMHLNKRNVLNIDLKDFFESFNFGRVRGFFISNRNFCLDPDIATVIAQIACYDNKLPQGSPCSPVITNLISHILDIQLAALAKANSCVYSRYADDITFSTRERVFPSDIMSIEAGEYIVGRKLRGIIKRAGFSLNEKKTRIQYKDSRQDVTGLVVNKKPNVKSEYWRTVKSQCHSLFKNGTFTVKKGCDIVEGSISELEGRLNFIDQIDLYNRRRQQPKINPEIALCEPGINTRILLNGREKTFSRFLYYCYFYANKKPMIICEGKTDNIYIKLAMSKLATDYPLLAKPKSSNSAYEPLVSLFKYSKRTRFLLQLYGGTSYLKNFIETYKKNFAFYKAPKPCFPIIIILDNDTGFKDINSWLDKSKYVTPYNINIKASENNKFRYAEFIHVVENLYIVLTPRENPDKNSAIEDLFNPEILKEEVSGKTFNPSNSKIDITKEYGKEIFAKKVIFAKRNSIDFSRFKVLLDRIVKCLEHYDSNK